MSKPLYIVAGVGCAIVALVFPSETLTGFHPGASDELSARLLTGGGYFRMACALLAAYFLLLGRVARGLPSPARTDSYADERNSGPATTTEKSLLAVILVVALILRLHALDAGLWYDEILTYVYYGQLRLGEAMTTYDSQNQHFLYTLAWKLLLPWFQDETVALRLPAVVFGVGSIAALYAFAAEMVGRREALAASLLMTLSYHHVWFSQNARGYTALMFFVIVSGHLLLRALRRPDPGPWILYAVAVALGAYAQPTMVLVCAGQFMAFAVHVCRPSGGGKSAEQSSRPGKRALPGLLFGFGLAAFLVVGAYAPVLPQFVSVSSSGGGSIAKWSNPLWAFFEFVHGMQVGGAGAVVLGTGVFVFAIGSMRLLRRSPLVVELFFFPVGITLAIVVISGHHIWPRLVLFAMGHALMIIVSGAIVMGRVGASLFGYGRERAQAVGMVGVAAACLVFVFALPRAYKPKQDFIGAMRFVSEQVRSQDHVVVAGLAVAPYIRYYNTGWDVVTSVEELEDIRRQSERTWLIYIFPFELKSGFPDIMAAVDREFTNIARFDGTLGGGAVYVVRSDG